MFKNYNKNVLYFLDIVYVATYLFSQMFYKWKYLIMLRMLWSID